VKLFAAVVDLATFTSLVYSFTAFFIFSGFHLPDVKLFTESDSSGIIFFFNLESFASALFSFC